jgi:hypothetical protein
MLASPRRKNAAKPVPLACVLALAALVAGCVDNGNDVGYQLPVSSAAAGGSVAAGGSNDVAGGTPGSGGSAPATTLPPLPRLTGVRTSVRGDSVSIGFEPLADAVDYRVYALPRDEDISVAADGDVTIRNAVYRCAGQRQVPPISARYRRSRSTARRPCPAAT